MSDEELMEARGRAQFGWAVFFAISVLAGLVVFAFHACSTPPPIDPSLEIARKIKPGMTKAEVEALLEPGFARSPDDERWSFVGGNYAFWIYSISKETSARLLSPLAGSPGQTGRRFTRVTEYHWPSEESPHETFQ